MQPKAEQKAILGNWGDLDDAGGYLVVLACVLRATSKKARQLFGKETCTPRENPAWLRLWLSIARSFKVNDSGTNRMLVCDFLLVSYHQISSGIC